MWSTVSLILSCVFRGFESSPSSTERLRSFNNPKHTSGLQGDSKELLVNVKDHLSQLHFRISRARLPGFKFNPPCEALDVK